MSDEDKILEELIELMEDEFNGHLNFKVVPVNEFLNFVKDWLLGRSEYQVPKNEKTQRINQLYWKYMFGEEFMADKWDEVKLK